MRTITLSLAFGLFASCVPSLLADQAHQRQVVRMGNLGQLTPKKGKHKVPKPHTARRVVKPSKRAQENHDNRPVWGTPDMKRARQKR